MSETLRTTIGPFSSSGERWQPRAANVRAVEPAADLPNAVRGSLYVFVEVSGSGGGHAALYRQMLNAAQTGFYEMGDTVDAALRQAVRNVHTVLKRANEALPEAGWRGGISLVVRYGPRLIIAQAGPGLVLVSHPKTIDQFPAQLRQWGPPLGGDERPEIKLYDAAVERGSMILLAQSDWIDLVTPEALAVAAAAPSVALGTQYLGQLAGSAELSACLVAFDADIPEVKAEPDVPLAERLGLGRTAVEPAPEEPSRPIGKGLLAGASRLLGRGRSQEERPAAEPEGMAGWSGEAAEQAVEPATPVTPVRSRPKEPAEPMRRVFPPEAGAASALPRARSPRPLQVQPMVGLAEEAVIGQGQLPGADAEPELPGEQRRRSIWPLLLALVVIPLIVAGIVLTMLYMRERALETQFVEKLDGIRNAITQAQAMSDDVAAAQHLVGARDFLDQARTLRPEDPRLAEAQRQYDELLARVQHVTPLYGLVPLYEFQQAGQRLERVLVSSDALFVLDKGANAVYRFILSALGDSVTPSQAPAARTGEQVGSQAIAELVDMTWSEAAGGSQRSRLMVLDTAGGLVSYDVTWGPERLTLGGSDKWVKPQLLASYGGNLYVADIDGDQIWRYRPAANGYGDPESYFQPGVTVDLAGLQAITIDGNIWLLFADGRLLKFFSGEQRSFDWLGNLPDPPSAPVSVAVTQERDSVFVADAGNGRIIEVTKDGEFVRQFRERDGDVLRQARSIFLDEAAGMFYILTANKLYKANVPTPAVAPAATSQPGQSQ